MAGNNQQDGRVSPIGMKGKRKKKRNWPNGLTKKFDPFSVTLFKHSTSHSWISFVLCLVHKLTRPASVGSVSVKGGLTSIDIMYLRKLTTWPAGKFGPKQKSFVTQPTAVSSQCWPSWMSLISPTIRIDVVKMLGIV